MKRFTALALPLLLASTAVFAGEPVDTIKANISTLVTVPIETVTKSNFAGLYEIVTSQGIAYTDDKGSFVLFNGVVVDSKTKENLTQKRIAEVSKFNFSELPLKDAIKVVRGDGSRVFATFEDPNCGFCKKLAPELAKMQNVTVYTFIIPILGDDSVKKAASIWCSDDRAAAWLSQMQNKGAPTAQTTCDNPMKSNVELSHKLKVTGTPAILFQDGSRIPGYVSTDVIEAKLSPKQTK